MVSSLNKIISAPIWVFGDNVSTDEIIPGKRLGERDMRKLARFAFENTKDDFAGRAKPGDVIVAGRNFGCGSSREQAVLVLKVLGVNLILARSFGRIFFRNCVNNGILPLKIKAPLGNLLKDGDEIQIDFRTDMVTAGDVKAEFERPPEKLWNIWRAGGLIEYLKTL
ncbi:MAG: 3-isopropylmalate dehydratase [Thermoplasmata archaeon]|nr:3-isopropylmalate dehydratase [Thermoplasmata archaeon]